MITLEANCAYKRICKGICSSPSSCIRSQKSEEDYWQEIQNAMVAAGRLERIRHYLSTKPSIIRTDIIEKWATVSNFIKMSENSPKNIS